MRLATLWRWHQCATLAAAVVNAALLVAAVCVARRSGVNTASAMQYYRYPVLGFARGVQQAMHAQQWLTCVTVACMAAHLAMTARINDKDDVCRATLRFVVVAGALTLAQLATLCFATLHWIAWQDDVWRQMSKRSRAWLVLANVSLASLMCALGSAAVTHRHARQYKAAAAYDDGEQQMD